jgi:hypothetical protein
MTDASQKDTDTTTSPADDKSDDVIFRPDSMNPHIVPEKDETEQASEK